MRAVVVKTTFVTVAIIATASWIVAISWFGLAFLGY
jgi:hypothetical protein